MAKNILLKIIIVLSINILSENSTMAKTIQSRSCSQDDIQAAIDLSIDGDIVSVPEGKCIFYKTLTRENVVSGLIIKKGISLIGSGFDKTTIEIQIDKDGITVEVDEPKFWRISGFSFTGGINNALGLIKAKGKSKNWRIDHNNFKDWGSRGIYVYGYTYGVIDNNIFDHNGYSPQGVLVREDQDNNGYEAWKRPYTPGSKNAVYIENNKFNSTKAPGDAAVDGGAGARIVIRHNTIHNQPISYHGTDSGSIRGTHSVEIYNNIFTNDCTEFFARVIHNRSGTLIAFDNMVSGCWGSFIHLNLYRVFVEDYKWQKCNGTKWGICSDKLYEVCNVDSDCSTGVCSRKFCSKNQDTVCTSDSDCPDFPSENCSRFFDGSGTDGYPCRDQMGRSTNQSLEPVYSWNNSFCSGSFNCTPIPNNGKISEARECSQLEENRDYFNNTIRPGYVPYTYPHPLTNPVSVQNLKLITP